MSNKNVNAITNKEQDFTQWYTDIVKKAELADYSGVAGCIIFRPYGYAIWENIKKALDEMLAETGHENVYMPMLIPRSLLQKEKDHIEGFAPEVAWVDLKNGEEDYCIRPTSETLFCEHYSKIIQSHRDLPIKYNQWCSVFRVEKTTRPFLRTREFLWQEGHTAHATREEAETETLNILDLYAKLCEDYIAMPVIKGKKSESEKFAGAVDTYCIESMMLDGKALQAGTTHYFGQDFAKVFDITYTDKNNKLQYVEQTSWGVSTRLMGGLIMTHSDNNGLVLPPNIAPIQVAIVPVAMHKEGVVEKTTEIKSELLANKIRCIADFSDKTPGFKFAEYEMKGVPLRLEIGPKDIEKGVCIIARRDTGEKCEVLLTNLIEEVNKLLVTIQKEMFERANALTTDRIYISTNYVDFVEQINNKQGFVKTMWCESGECEEKVKAETGAITRCIPFEQEHLGDKCCICGKPAEKMAIWGKSY